MTILAIETSCDETAASLLKIVNCKLKIASNIVSSQVKIHAQYGGIVPEVAARKHAENIVPVLETALANLHKSSFANIRESKLVSISDSIDAIAVTNGPGLITSLLVGVEAAKTLAFLANKPLIPVNHLAGHIYANFVREIPNSKFQIPNSPVFPAICLVVSGGHTELILMKDFEKFQKIGQTLDDAAGECFDKVAKILGLGYPGGPSVAYEATKFKNKNEKIKNIELPRPMINSPDFNFSFSGLKTAVLYSYQKSKIKNQNYISEMCREIQQAIIDVLIAKTIKAAKKYQAKSIILGGGVVANEELRKQFASKVYSLPFKVRLFVSPKSLCTDNAAMIAVAGYFKLISVPKSQWLKKFDWRRIEVNPNLEI